MKVEKFLTLKNIKRQKFIDKPLISIGIRVKNEINFIDTFWQTITTQTIFDKLEIVFLDSGSVDGTFEYLKSLNCSLYTISSEEFKFGTSCNLIMQLTQCKYVCFFSGHVELAKSNLMEELNKFIQENKDFSGYFRQVPNYNVGCSIYDKVFLKFNFPKKKSSSPIPLKGSNRFSNAASIVCRNQWELIKFKDVIASEDAFWAEDVINEFEQIYYFHNLEIRHSHNENYESIEKRITINMNARYPKGINPIKRKIIFLKVFFALFLNTFYLKKSYFFARAHAKGYQTSKS